MTNNNYNKNNNNNYNNINNKKEKRKLSNGLNKTSIVVDKENNNLAQFETEMNNCGTTVNLQSQRRRKQHEQQQEQQQSITKSVSGILSYNTIRNTEIIEESFEPLKKLLAENSKDEGIKSQLKLQQEQNTHQKLQQKLIIQQQQIEKEKDIKEENQQKQNEQQQNEHKLPKNCQKIVDEKTLMMMTMMMTPPPIATKNNSLIIPTTTISRKLKGTETGTASAAGATTKTPITEEDSSKLSFSSRNPRRKVLPSLDCLLVTAIFSLIFLMVGNLQIGVTASSLMGSSLKNEPMFISRSETFKFVAGDIIQLPCEVANAEAYVVAWKRGIAILSAGAVKVTPDPRVRLVKGFNLYIRDAVPQDAGDYICQIATLEPREITHTVEILVPPRIHHISSGGHLQVKKGSSVRIECSASGNPTPNVTWSRKNNILPNGEEKLHSHILSIEHMDRHKGGVYICSANNNVGQPASSQVVLHVLYPPEISVERPIVFSGEGREAMLVCIVHGETQPDVIWFKETMQLDTTERHIMENRGSRHTLIIRKVHQQDFGNYSCVAENQLGKSRKTLQLSGKPNVAVFNSPPISQYKDKYNISWTADSHSPIEEFKLYYRRLPQGHEVDNQVEQSETSHQSSMIQMYNSGGISSSNHNNNHRMNGVGSYGTNLMHWGSGGRNDWRDVVLPAMPLSHHFTQGMNYMIRGLDPDQQYEAKVEARNRYGWSSMTNNFIFSTSSNDGQIDLSSFHGLSDNEMRDLSVTFYGSAAESRSFASKKILVICLSLFYFTIYFKLG